MNDRDGSPMVRRGGMVLLILLAGMILFLTKAYIIGGDDGTYISLAHGILSGEYRSPVHPAPVPEVQYPPMMPLLLVPAAFVSPWSLEIFRAEIALVTIILFIGVIEYRRIRDGEEAVWHLLPVVVSPLLLEYGTSVITEGPYIGLAYLTLAVAEGRREEGKGLLPAFIMAGFALYLRQAAWGLVGGLFIFAIARRRFRDAALGVAAAIFIVIPWWIWQNMNSSDYLRSHIMLRDIYDPSKGTASPLYLLLGRPFTNYTRYLARISTEALGIPGLREVMRSSPLFPLKVAVSLAISAAAIWGFLRSVRKDGIRAEDGYAVATLILLGLHPVYADRYLFPLIPTIWSSILRPFSPRVRRNLALLGLLLGLLGSALSYNRDTPGEWTSFIEACSFIKENTPPGSVVISRKPSSTWFYARRSGISYPATSDPAALASSMEAYSADYLIEDRFVIGVPTYSIYLKPAMEGLPGRFEEVFRAEEAVVWRIIPMGGSGDCNGG